MLLGTLGASMLGNMLTGKGVMSVGRGYDNMDNMDKMVFIQKIIYIE